MTCTDVLPTYLLVCFYHPTPALVALTSPAASIKSIASIKMPNHSIPPCSFATIGGRQLRDRIMAGCCFAKVLVKDIVYHYYFVLSIEAHTFGMSIWQKFCLSFVSVRFFAYLLHFFDHWSPPRPSQYARSFHLFENPFKKHYYTVVRKFQIEK